MSTPTSEPIVVQPAVPEGIRKARAALRRDLPALLTERRVRGKWACYASDGRVGIGDDYAVLIAEVVRRGIADGEYVIERILPGAEGEDEDEIDRVDV